MKSSISKPFPLEKSGFLLLTAGVIFLFWKIMAPFALVLLTAGIAAIVFTPLQRWLERVLKHPKLAALFIVLGVFVAIVLPLFYSLFLMITEASEIVQGSLGEAGWLRTFDIRTFPFFQILPDIAQTYLTSIDVSEITRNGAEWAFQHLGSVFSSTTRLLLNTFLFFMAFYFILIDRHKLMHEIITLSPLRDTVDKDILKRIIQTVRSVVFGAIILSVIQGIFAAIGMTIFGVPGAVIWGAATIIAAQIPIFGVPLVMAPAVAYLFVNGQNGAGIGLAIWSLTVVGLCDNVLGPYLIKGNTHMHTLLILFSILGGIEVFGSIGFIIGPTILASFLVVLELYQHGFLEKSSEK